MERGVGNRGITSVFIIAASDVVRAELEALIGGEEDLRVIGSAVHWSTLSAPETEPPDVVIYDTERREAETLGSLQSYVGELRAGSNVPAVITIGTERDEWLRELLSTGLVRATLSRSASSAEIVAAVRAVSSGLIALDPETFAAVFPPSPAYFDSANAAPYDQPASSIEPLIEELTPREREVLEMLAGGLSNKEIAWRMKISEHTVKFHVASIFGKLGASSRTEAVMLGIRRGLVMM